ncbi:hypothetical protein HELRODRAFT_172057 [Helobdella robusta]|uniref:Uncharacterized protein n=1 Tax=Helobdella robusta TaxID=6412 RepID=T1F4Z4_HELRO|nr:hypothetical protein HELRODRAFT_172057 [Helobdella robusta]ESO05044.1 hypothetical protein HELRODRAFT_172057 [Helobdella robusta]
MDRDRKYAMRFRLRKELEKRKMSLADDFQFKIYSVFHFKEKPCTVFESVDIVNVMTNNLKDQIYKNFSKCGSVQMALADERKNNDIIGNNYNDNISSVNNNMISEADDMFSKDIVQLHLTRWMPHVEDRHGQASSVDFLLCPRSDVTKIECRLFSRWRDQPLQAYLPLQCKFILHAEEWNKKLQKLTTTATTTTTNISTSAATTTIDSSDVKTKKLLMAGSVEKIVANENKDMFIFVKKHQVQDQLLSWEPRTSYDVLKDY